MDLHEVGKGWAVLGEQFIQRGAVAGKESLQQSMSLGRILLNFGHEGLHSFIHRWPSNVTEKLSHHSFAGAYPTIATNATKRGIFRHGSIIFAGDVVERL
jgi:hypothetical protein